MSSNLSKNDPRRRQVKKGLDADDARRKREEFVVELRRNKREEQIQKRRARADHSVAAGGEAASGMNLRILTSSHHLPLLASEQS
jgi:hypothetical protein